MNKQKKSNSESKLNLKSELKKCVRPRLCSLPQLNTDALESSAIDKTRFTRFIVFEVSNKDCSRYIMRCTTFLPKSVKDHKEKYHYDLIKDTRKEVSAIVPKSKVKDMFEGYLEYQDGVIRVTGDMTEYTEDIKAIIKSIILITFKGSVSVQYFDMVTKKSGIL